MATYGIEVFGLASYVRYLLCLSMQDMRVGQNVEILFLPRSGVLFIIGSSDTGNFQRLFANNRIAWAPQANCNANIP
jgi:hypothetical protein